MQVDHQQKDKPTTLNYSTPLLGRLVPLVAHLSPKFNKTSLLTEIKLGGDCSKLLVNNFLAGLYPRVRAVMPSALSDLPNEILEQIIEETRPREIARFVSCCRLIFTLGHKALESHRLETAFFSVFDLRRCLQDGEAADVYRCLWGLVVDPSRALYLRKLQFSDGYLLGLDKSTFQLIPEILHRASASRNPQYMSIKHSENVRSAFMKGRMMAIALVMLMFAPNLEELSIRLRGPPYGKLTADVVRQIAQVNEIARSNSQDERFNHRSLGNLLKVEILVEPSGNLRTADNLQILDAFLEQPSLKILKGSMILGAKLSRHI